MPIVDSMTYEEVSKYLWRYVFDSEHIEHIMDIYYRHQNKYKKAMREWNRRPVDKRDEILIFPPIKYKVLDLHLRAVPYYSGAGKYIDFIYFTTFHYRNRKFVAMKLNKSGVMFYSWHALHRYAERYLKEPDAEINDSLIGDILIYNVCSEPTRYNYHGKLTNMFVTRDGAFLGDLINEDLIVAYTFISESEYFPYQAELDKEAFLRVQKYKAENYGDIIERH